LPLLLLSSACAAQVEPPAGTYADLSHCAPGTTHSCPCFGGGTGTQICDDTGGRYGACIGCEEGGAGANGSAGGSSDQLGTVPGVACGVAYPVLCAPGRETCCVRSLSVDSCIDSTHTCGCGTLDCRATAVRCDGPEDCADGESCCGSTVDSNDANGYTGFACAAECASDQRVACHAGQTACPIGLICANSQFLTNMQVCVDPASLAQ